MGLFTDDQSKQLIKEKDLKTAADVQEALKEIFGKTSKNAGNRTEE